MFSVWSQEIHIYISIKGRDFFPPLLLSRLRMYFILKEIKLSEFFLSFWNSTRELQ